MGIQVAHQTHVKSIPDEAHSLCEQAVHLDARIEQGDPVVVAPALAVGPLRVENVAEDPLTTGLQHVDTQPRRSEILVRKAKVIVIDNDTHEACRRMVGKEGREDVFLFLSGGLKHSE